MPFTGLFPIQKKIKKNQFFCLVTLWHFSSSDTKTHYSPIILISEPKPCNPFSCTQNRRKETMKKKKKRKESHHRTLGAITPLSHSFLRIAAAGEGPFPARAAPTRGAARGEEAPAPRGNLLVRLLAAHDPRQTPAAGGGRHPRAEPSPGKPRPGGHRAFSRLPTALRGTHRRSRPGARR